MNLKKKILDKFGNIDLKNLLNYKGNRIRVYFDEYGENELDKILIISNSIMKEIFNDNLIIVCLMFYGENSIIDFSILESIKQRNFYNVIECGESEQLNNDGGYVFCYYNKVVYEDLLKINKAIVEKDYGIDPELYLNSYYFSIEKNVIVNLYDDRGMDIVSTNKKYLDELYEKFHNNYNMKIE